VSSSKDQQIAADRWRLVLGRFAEEALPLGGRDQRDLRRMDRVLEYLYGREYGKRGIRDTTGREGGMGASQLNVPDWIREARELFPREPMEVLTRHALQRYQMTELVTDPQVLEGLEPDYDLLKSILTFRGLMSGPVLDVARRVVRKVVDELVRSLTLAVRPVLWGRAAQQRHTLRPTPGGLDFQRTIRANLKNFNVKRKQIVVDQLHFHARNARCMPWRIVMVVDCSGSMTDSVIHSAIMAAIFHKLPAVRVNLVAFDTSIIDLSDRVDDPLEVLMSVQLGGGTDIARALAYCERLVETPARTIVVLVTDFFEGNSPALVVSSVTRLREAGAIVLGLAALDPEANPNYDRQLAQRCADAGAEIAALTPLGLTQWLSKVIY